MTSNNDLDYDKDNVWHVLPTGEDHAESGFECWCNPKIEIQDNGGVVVTHNSLDWREYIERIISTCCQAEILIEEDKALCSKCGKRVYFNN